MDNDFYWFWLCNLDGIGRARIRALLSVFGTPEEVYNSDLAHLAGVKGISTDHAVKIHNSKHSDEIYKRYMKMRRGGICFTYPGKEDYPKRLMNTYDYPFCLYYKGSMPSDSKPSVAIVGARQCSHYGKVTAQYLASQFSDMGIQIISGMAYGIDAAAHQGTIDHGGYTCAVLGCGVDICYPRDNIELYSYMSEYGGIISEYPLGTAPNAGQFPVRNRIISALSDAVIVVEARRKSGSLITVDQALEQNREVYAVPGRIGDEMSIGCNELIKMGAGMITEPQDILWSTRIRELLNHHAKDSLRGNTRSGEQMVLEGGSRQKNRNFVLATPKDMLYSCLGLYPMSINEIISKSGMTIQEISGLLVELELEGKVREISKNCYAKASFQD